MPNKIVSESYIDFVVRQLKSSPPKMAIEFGTGNGKLTALLGKHATKVITVDSDPDKTTYAKQRLAVLSDRVYDNVIFVTGYTDVPLFDESYDMVLINLFANEMENIFTIVALYWDRIAKDATIVFNDANDKTIGPFIKGLADKYKCPCVLSNTGDGIGVLIKW